MPHHDRPCHTKPGLLVWQANRRLTSMNLRDKPNRPPRRKINETARNRTLGCELLRAVIKPAVTPRRFSGRLGRRPKLSAHQKREALARREAGEPLAEIARSYNVSHSTISRLQAQQ